MVSFNNSVRAKDNRFPAKNITILFLKHVNVFFAVPFLAFGLYRIIYLRYLTTCLDSEATKQFVFFMMWFSAITFFCAILVLLNNRFRIETVFVGFALMLGLLYLFAMTPLSIPDEPHHYHSSYELSNVFCVHWDALEYGDAADFNYIGLAGHYNVSSAYQRIVEDFAKESVKEGLVLIPKPRSLAYPLEYFPQALGISIARLFHANFIIMFFAGRFCNLLFYVICCYIAVKTVPRFKLLFCLIGILPMALHQAASYSYDGFINGMSLLLTSLFLRSIWQDAHFTKREGAQIMAVGILLAPAKLIYWTILLLVFLIPKERFQNSKQRRLFACAVLGAPLIFAVLMQLPTLATVAVQPAETLNWEGRRNYTLDFILQHPVQTIKIFLQTFILSAAEWFETSIGSCLSGLTLKISNRSIYLFVLLLLLSSLSGSDTLKWICPRERILFLGISLSVVFLTMLYMFLIWTSDYRLLIMGVQGRYFIPILPLLFLSCNNRAVAATKPYPRLILSSAVFINLDIVVQVLNYTVGH